MTVIRRDSDEVRPELTALPGTGRWTCDMFQLFYAGEPDFLPVEDGLSGSHSHGSTAPRSTIPPHGRSSAWIGYTILDSFMRYGRYPRKAGRGGRPEAPRAHHEGERPRQRILQGQAQGPCRQARRGRAPRRSRPRVRRARIVSDPACVRVGSKRNHACPLADPRNREIAGHAAGGREDARLVKPAFAAVVLHLRHRRLRVRAHVCVDAERRRGARVPQIVRPGSSSPWRARSCRTPPCSAGTAP